MRHLILFIIGLMRLIAAKSRQIFHNQATYRKIVNGYLYNWHAVNDERGLAPNGWHVPTLAEFQALIAFLGGVNASTQAALKEAGTTHWAMTGGTNTSGFTGLGSGIRTNDLWDGCFAYQKSYGHFWSSTSSYYLELLEHMTEQTLIYEGALLWMGKSVRLIRDSDIGWKEGDVLKDYDNNGYDTVKIGTQIWTVQNLAVSHYKDGTEIPIVAGDAAWAALLTGALCAYENNLSNV